MTWRENLLRFLRVPHAPEPPVGDEDVQVFRAAPSYFQYRLVRYVISNIGALIGLYFGTDFMTRIPTGGIWIFEFLLALAETLAIAGFVFQAIARLLILRLDIDQRWYMVTDRSLRIREGLINMNEKTMTFANIQNVRIEQGPVQRLFGIADLQVRTAGGGSSLADEGDEAGTRDLHIGYFRGVDNAEMIRDTIRERMRRHLDAGLGDPDDVVAAESNSLLEAANALALEAGALRRSRLRLGPVGVVTERHVP